MGAGVVDELVTILGIEIKDDGLPAFRSSITSTIGKFGLLVAGAVSATAAISAFLRTASETNASSKFARSINIGFEAIQKMEFAAKRTGVEAGSLDSVLANLFTTAGDAKRGKLGGAAQGLLNLGVQLLDAGGKAKDARTLFLETLDAVANAKDQTSALSFARDGGFGIEFTEALKSGSAAFIALEREAVSSRSIISNATAQRAERAKESIDVIGKRIETILLENGEFFLEFGKDGSKALLDFSRSDSFKKLEDRFKALGKVIGETIGTDIRALKDFFETPIGGVVVDTVLATVVAKNPGKAVAAAGLVAVADVQEFREGKKGTTSEKILDFLSRAGDSFAESQRAKFASEAAVRENLGIALSNPFALNPFAAEASKIEINQDINIQGVSDSREVFNLLQQLDGDAIREAEDTINSKVVR